MSVGSDAHGRAARAAQESLRGIPLGARVRLAKPTSNLFRARTRTQVGLAVNGLDGVIDIDPSAGTVDVQGMCTYERLLDVTLAHGMMPLVVPQLKTITVGGAVTGLGVESSSLRSGLPHESVLEMDVLTGLGEIVTASAESHPDLFDAFPNSYGSLGYALRLRIRIEPVSRYVELRHVRFTGFDELIASVDAVADTGTWDGEVVDFIDGVVFAPHECYLTMGRWSSNGRPSDYTGQQIYYQSIRGRTHDCLAVRDYLWRWDTDWFWCSAAFGVQQPFVRRLWPRRYRRSDVYHRILRLDQRHELTSRVESWRRRPRRERVVQDVEVPLERAAGFLTWLSKNVEVSPVWLCPLRPRRRAPLYPLDPSQTYINVGFWGSVPIQSGAANGDVNRSIEKAVAASSGLKSLYSDAYYDRDEFDAIYGGDTLQRAKQQYDPHDRFTGRYEKVVDRR